MDTPTNFGATKGTAIPSPERNTEAPEPFTTELGKQDISLAPEEAFEGVGSGSQSNASPFGFAGGEEADMAFIESEQERAMTDPADEMGDLVDDRDQTEKLTDFGLEADATQHRESRGAVEEATEFGVDDRSNAGRGDADPLEDDTQSGFEEFGGGVRENETLF